MREIDQVVLDTIRSGASKHSDILQRIRDERRYVRFRDVDNACQRLRRKGLIKFLKETKRWATVDRIPCPLCKGSGTVLEEEINP